MNTIRPLMGVVKGATGSSLWRCALSGRTPDRSPLNRLALVNSSAASASGNGEISGNAEPAGLCQISVTESSDSSLALGSSATV
ncbi:hypothetical protein D9M69_657350 [compost metagenome]